MEIHLFWFKNWLFFCIGLFLLYFLIKFFEQTTERKWISEIKKKHLVIERNYKFKKRDLNKISCSEMESIVSDSDFKKLAERPAWFELFEKEKIVFFEVPWGEVYCECHDTEYNELVGYIRKKSAGEFRGHNT